MSENGTTQYPRRKTSAFSDPVVLTLSLLIFAVIIGSLLFVLASLTMGYLGGNAPKTAGQAALVQRKNQVTVSSDEPEAWFDYIKILASEKQFSTAQNVVKEGMEKFKETDDYDFFMLSSQAYLFFAQGQYDKTIEQALIAQEKMEVAYERMLESDVSPNRAKSYGISSNHDEMTLLMAGAHTALGEHEKTAELLKEYLADRPTEAGVWIDLGNAFAALGNKEKAIEAFDEALYYMPDSQEALDAKAALGAN